MYNCLLTPNTSSISSTLVLDYSRSDYWLFQSTLCLLIIVDIYDNCLLPICIHCSWNVDSLCLSPVPLHCLSSYPLSPPSPHSSLVLLFSSLCYQTLVPLHLCSVLSLPLFPLSLVPLLCRICPRPCSSHLISCNLFCISYFLYFHLFYFSLLVLFLYLCYLWLAGYLLFGFFVIVF